MDHGAIIFGMDDVNEITREITKNIYGLGTAYKSRTIILSYFKNSYGVINYASGIAKTIELFDNLIELDSKGFIAIKTLKGRSDRHDSKLAFKIYADFRDTLLKSVFLPVWSMITTVTAEDRSTKKEKFNKYTCKFKQLTWCFFQVLEDILFIENRSAWKKSESWSYISKLAVREVNN